MEVVGVGAAKRIAPQCLLLSSSPWYPPPLAVGAVVQAHPLSRHLLLQTSSLSTDDELTTCSSFKTEMRENASRPKS